MSAVEPVLLHEHAEFGDAIGIVAARRGLAEPLVEKDYWVCHTLWALGRSGLSVAFKGGTSLSKGYGLIHRFSEDLDVKVDGPRLPPVSDWRGTSASALRARQRYFEVLGSEITVPGATVTEDVALRDQAWRSSTFSVAYPKRSAGALPPVMSPHVRLEVGSARVTPGEPRWITSWLHELLAEQGRLGTQFVANLPGEVHCVLPHVTLLEKIEALSRRFSRAQVRAETFVRHFEDAYHIIASLGPQDLDLLRALRDDMAAVGDLRHAPDPSDLAFCYNPTNDAWKLVERAWSDAEGLFWGPRVPVAACVERIRSFLLDLD